MILSLLAICINGCQVNSRNKKVVEVATDEVTEENVAIKVPMDPVAEAVLPVKIEKRPLLPSKRTGQLDDIPAVAKTPNEIYQRLLLEKIKNTDSDL